MEDSGVQAPRRDALITSALARILEILRAAPSTTRSRELLAQARSFDRAVKHWATVPPSNAQLDAMFDLIVELHASAVAVTFGHHPTPSSG